MDLPAFIRILQTSTMAQRHAFITKNMANIVTAFHEVEPQPKKDVYAVGSNLAAYVYTHFRFYLDRNEAALIVQGLKGEYPPQAEEEKTVAGMRIINVSLAGGSVSKRTVTGTTRIYG